ncbi:hypothetical protein FAM09_15670 [Niastella caeni]|uniref:Lipoprotein n=1 Tax=Niastella caeni TaxID=2569763 RepID=A0A4S8HSY6_9BACT|nr:hypothetical protein [Niastella caeni]THU38121.1 hypothetical protein FAM09_15670 [Niastella caeni]
MPTSKLLVILSISFLSCNYGQVNKQHTGAARTDTMQKKETEISKEAGNQKMPIPADTTSSDYLIYLLKNDMPLTGYWTQQLKKLDAFAIPLDSTTRLSVTRDWTINDSISVVILQYSTNVGGDEFLLTVKNKRQFIARVHISNEYDSDVSEENPDYYYTEYQMIDDRKIKLLLHKIKNYDTDKEKDVVTIEHWTIQSNGKVLKNKML